MSGTILYLAIVAIWAGVLVPRWISHEPRRDSSPRSAEDGTSSQRTTSSSSATSDAMLRGATDIADAGNKRRDPPGQRGAVDVSQRRRADTTQRTQQVLAARRRLLGMLVLLLAGAVGAAVTGLAAWWVVAPPSGMLAGYITLLREVARADAERRQASRPAAHASKTVSGKKPDAMVRIAANGTPGDFSAPRDTGVDLARKAEVAAADRGLEVRAEAAATAKVLDISELVGEEIYDQYTDAKLRAVGD